MLFFPYSFLDSFLLLQDIEYSSLCYTVGPCWLSILYARYPGMQSQVGLRKHHYEQS